MSHQIRFLLAFSVAIMAPRQTSIAFANARCGGPCETCRTCVAQDDGTGTIIAPLSTCEFTGGRYILRAGLPAGSTIECDYRIGGFFDVCPPVSIDCYDAGPPPPGWQSNSFRASLTLWMTGTGAMAGFERTITIPVACQSHVAPHTRGPAQSFDTDMFAMEGQLPPGDPDFDLLRITAGSGFGMPSPGHTTLTAFNASTNVAPPWHWAVDSFFDIEYRIDFVGHPGSPLGGMSGTTTGEKPVHATNGGAPLPLAPMNSLGSADTPAPNIDVVAPGDGTLDIVNGLPPGTTFKLKPKINTFSPALIVPGSIGGPGYQVNAQVTLDGQGTGALGGYQRTFVIPHVLECHVGPIDPTADVQSLDNVLQGMQGQLPPGDPDFDLLRITAGNGFGLRSPGHTTLARVPGLGDLPRWNVDSFFDITYRIDFVGHPGGPFSGMSGSTVGTIHMTQGGELPRYEINAFGLPHAGTSNVVIVGDTDGDLRVSNIGSSGQDGVSIYLNGNPRDGCEADLSCFGLQGWGGEIDFGPSGNLPSGAMLRAKGTIKGRQGGDGGANGIIQSPSISISALNNGQATLSLDEGCDPMCAGTLCQCCPNSPGCASLAVSFFNVGQLVATKMYSPPWPANLVTGPFGSETLPTGEVAGMNIVFELHNSSPSNVSGYDRMHMLARGRTTKTWQTAGGGAVQADTIQLTVAIPPNSDGTSPVLGLEEMTITGANVMAGGLTGVLEFRNEIVEFENVAVLGLHPQKLPAPSAQVFAQGGLDDHSLDTFHTVVLSHFGSSGQNGVEFFDPGSEPFDGWTWPPRALASIGARLLVLDTTQVAPDGTLTGGQLPPNGSLGARFKFSGENTPVIKGSALRCTSGTCDTVDLHADFSALGATTMRVEAYLQGTLVGAVDGVTGTLVATAPGTLIVTGIKSVVPVQSFGPPGSTCGDCPTESFSLSVGPVSLPGSPPLTADNLRCIPENPVETIPVEILSMELTGANICQLEILDIQATPLPLPSPCPGDVSIPPNHVVDIDDLVQVIVHWGACNAACAPGAATTCPGDANHNCLVNIDDLVLVITSWGACP